MGQLRDEIRVIAESRSWKACRQRLILPYVRGGGSKHKNDMVEFNHREDHPSIQICLSHLLP